MADTQLTTALTGLETPNETEAEKSETHPTDAETFVETPPPDGESSESSVIVA